MFRRWLTRQGLLSAIMTICGIAIALVPLALWVAPTVLIFKLVLLVGGLAFLIIVVLAKLYPEDRI